MVFFDFLKFFALQKQSFRAALVANLLT